MNLLHIGLSPGDNGLTRALRKICDDYQEIPTNAPDLNQQIMAITVADLVWIQIQAPGIDPVALQHLRNIGAYVINWTGDVRRPIPSFYFEYAKHVDLTCFSNMNDVDTFNSLGWPAAYLQIGFDPAIYTPNGPTLSNVPEIVFMGNRNSQFPLSQLRYEMVQELQRVYGSRFGIYGNGWQPSAGNFNNDQHGEAAIYRSAKIAINLSHFNYRRYSSDRLYRALGCGIMVLTHNFDQFDLDFTDETHFAVWSNIEHLKSEIDYFLANDSHRQTIAENGHKHAMKLFTFDCMAQNIFELYQNRNNA